MPPRSNLPTPDSISGERSIGTPFVDLRATARQRESTYRTPVGSQIQDIPTENSLTYLADALKGFNPTLSNVLGQQKQYYEEREAESGAIMGERLAAARVKVADAVKSGQIPAGASRPFMEAVNATELKYAGIAHASAYQAAYEKAGVRNNPDPNAYSNFAAEFNNTYLAKVTEGKSMRERAYSKIDETIAGHTNSLSAQHVQWQIEDRKQKGIETLKLGVGQVLKLDYNNSKPETAAVAAAKIEDLVTNPVTGIGYHGFTPEQANRLVIDEIAAIMVQEGDPEYRKVAEAWLTKEGASIGKSSHALGRFKEAEDSILREQIQRRNWEDQSEERQAMIAGGFGPKQQGEAKAREAQRHEETAKHTEEMRSLAKVEQQKNVESESHLSAVMNAIREGTINSSKIAKGSLKWLDQHDPSKSMVIHNYMDSKKRDGGTFIDSPKSEIAYAQLRMAMSDDPMAFNSSMILAAITNGTVNPKYAGPLFDDWDRAKTSLSNPFMRNEEYKEIRTGLMQAVRSDRTSAIPTLEDQARGMKVSQQLQEIAYDWLKSNPKGNYRDFLSEMRKHVDPLVLQHSPELAKAAAAKQEKITNPKPVPQRDTRSTMERMLPNVLGGKSKPSAVTAAPGPKPLTPIEIQQAMKPAAIEKINQMMADPDVDEIELSAAIANSGLWATMKANGRTAAEYHAIHDRLISQRGKK